MAKVAKAFSESTVPRRGEGNKAQGDETRLRIVVAAVDVFAELGYDGASTRLLASRGGVNLASLTYYFAGKPALYRAALDYVVEQINETLRPNAERLRTLLTTAACRTIPERDLYLLLFDVLDQWLDLHIGRNERQWGEGTSRNWSRLLTRAEIDPPIGDTWLYQTTADLILKPCTALVGRLIGQEPESETCVLLALSILGLVHFFKPDRDRRSAVVGWTSITEDHRATLASLLHRNVRAIIGAAVAANPEGSRPCQPTDEDTR